VKYTVGIDLGSTTTKAVILGMDGAVLGRGCVVGAGSVARGRLEPYSINVGNPIRTIGSRRKPAAPQARRA